MSSSDRVVDLLNTASRSMDSNQIMESLKIVKEIILNKEMNLLDNFLDEVMAFQNNRSQEVRKFVVGFAEDMCKKDPSMLPKVIANLQMLMADSAVQVQKRVIQAMTHLYKVTLIYLTKQKSISDDMMAAWSMMNSLKEIITHLLEAQNDGIRMHAVKFMEILVITQTSKDQEDVSRAVAKKNDSDFGLDDIPLTFKLVKRRQLEEEAGTVFEEMVKYLESDYISSANLMTCMGALSNIARNRPQFMAKVITAFEMLQANFPPTLAKSQVSSVRKLLKNQLLSLLKHPVAAEEFFSNVTTLLTDLGASREEVMKAMPKYEEMSKKARKRAEKKKRDERDEINREAKKIKVEVEEEMDEEEDDEDDEEDEEEEIVKRSVKRQTSKGDMETAIDITEKFIIERMSPALAAELVINSMHRLPHSIPAHFHNTYTPIAAAGTEGQVQHVSRLMATQLTAAKMGPGVEEMKKRESLKRQRQVEDEEEEESRSKKDAKISTLIGRSTFGEKSKKIIKSVPTAATTTLQPAGLTNKKSRGRTFRLAEITVPLGEKDTKMQLSSALKRILKADKWAVMGGVPKLRSKMITALGAQFSSDMKGIMLDYIFEDVKSRTELAFSWLFEEYCYFQGFNRASSMHNKRHDDTEYNSTLCLLIKKGLIMPPSAEREELLRKLYLEAPIITEDAIELLKQFIQIDGAAIAVVNLTKDLVMLRPTRKLNFLNFLLEFCAHENLDVRETACKTVLQLHANGDFNEIIENYSVMYLKFLLNSEPPSMLFGEDRGRPQALKMWTEDLIKVCLYLYLNLVPQNVKLLDKLVEVFIAAKINIKKTILQVLDATVRKLDMNDPDLLKVIENCTKKSEHLITKMLLILTEKSMPSPELVTKVKALYDGKQVSDVRFLIPVLNGMKKADIITLLPKLLTQKQALSRLIRSDANSPLNPQDLLISLHNLDPSKCDPELVKAATSMCLKERKVFTQNVLSIVLQQLVNQPNIPFLFMRTTIESLKMYPAMSGFVMGLMQKLIVKQVWKHAELWEGFILCCKQTVPQSYAVILQLPPPQLRMFFNSCKDLREPILQHVQEFNESQRAHISKETMLVLYEEDESEEQRQSGVVEPNPPGL